MNRTERAKVRSMRETLDMNRAIKNDALQERTALRGCMFPQQHGNSRFEQEKQIFNSSKKALRRTKKYNGPTGSMSESNYLELMGA